MPVRQKLLIPPIGALYQLQCNLTYKNCIAKPYPTFNGDKTIRDCREIEHALILKGLWHWFCDDTLFEINSGQIRNAKKRKTLTQELYLNHLLSRAIVFNYTYCCIYRVFRLYFVTILMNWSIINEAPIGLNRTKKNVWLKVDWLIKKVSVSSWRGTHYNSGLIFNIRTKTA